MASRERDEHIKKLMEQGAKKNNTTRAKNNSRGTSSPLNNTSKQHTMRTRGEQSTASGRSATTTSASRSSQSESLAAGRKNITSARPTSSRTQTSERATPSNRTNKNTGSNKKQANKKSFWGSLFSKSKKSERPAYSSADNVNSTKKVRIPYPDSAEFRANQNKPKPNDRGSFEQNEIRFQRTENNTKNIDNHSDEPNKENPSNPYEINSENTPDSNVFLALGLLFIAGFLMICCTSHLIYWDVDQSVSHIGAMAKSNTTMNWGNTLGAIISNEIMSRGFGIAGLLLPWAVLLGAIKVLHIPGLRISRGIISTLFVMLILSVALGHFAGYNSSMLGGGLGGEIGVYTADWLNKMIGYAGTTLLVIILFVGVAYFAWRKPIINFYSLVCNKWEKFIELYDAKRTAKLALLQEKTAEAQLRTQKIIASKREAELEAQTLRERLHASSVPAYQTSDRISTTESGYNASVDHSQENDKKIIIESLSSDQITNNKHDESATNCDQEINNLPSELVSESTDNTNFIDDESTKCDNILDLSHDPNLVESIYETGRYGYLVGLDSMGQEIIYYWIGEAERTLAELGVDNMSNESVCSEISTNLSVAENLQISRKPVKIDTINEDEYTGDDIEITLQSKESLDNSAALLSKSNDIITNTHDLESFEFSQNAQTNTNVANILESANNETLLEDSANNYSANSTATLSHNFSIKNSEVMESLTNNYDESSTNDEFNINDSETEIPQEKEYYESDANTVVARFAPSKEDPNFIVEQTIQEEEIDEDTINLSELYDPTLELARYSKPPIELLANHSRQVTVTEEELIENKNRIVTTLENFGIKIDTIEATIGPTVTLYEIIPAPGVRISKIKNLEDDIALSLSALGIRIIAPIPGKGTIGIEVPNKDKEVVSMYSVIRSAKFQDSKAELPIALGKTIQNETFVMDLAKMPHLLVAGATGQGKSVGLNAIITSLLYKKHPSELKFILVDPKKVELSLYSMLEKHFLAKLPDAEEAIITDTQKVIYTLNSLCMEMDARYDLLKAAKVRNIIEYNEKFINRRLNPNKGHRFLPYFVVVVDEFADLIMTAGREIETPIARIAQLARAVGIHLIIATQRPTTNIITGVIKANFPARIAFRVSSMIDSRTILDSPGANQLIGKGDMLVSSGSEMTRVQCAFIDTPEVEMIADHIGQQKGYPTAYELPEYVPEGDSSISSVSEDVLNKRDSLFEEVARYVVSNDNGSASTIQRKFSIGFNRAGRIMDQLEAAGIVTRAEGSKPRQVLIQDILSLEHILNNL